MSNDSATAAPSTSEAVHELIRQLVDGRFVLTDRDGAVTRWSRPAEELFGWTSARMLGRPLAQAMDLPELPPGGGRLAAKARRKDESELQLTLTLVPVGMSQSLEFNGFLEALEAAGPYGASIAQVEASHRGVVESIAAAFEGRADLGDGPVAGMIVAFEAPGPAELPGLSDLRAEVESLRSGLEEARERVDALEAAKETTSALRAELAATRARLETLEDQRANERELLAAELEQLRESVRRGEHPSSVPATLDKQAREALQAAEEAGARLKDSAAGLDAKVARVEEAAALAERLIAEAEVLRRTLDESIHGRGYEAPLALRPYDGNGASHHAAPPNRTPRPGFDDVPRPLATFGLDGHFRDLNQAFTELVGYPEEKFRAAVWPPVTDHSNLARHREQMEALLEGTVDSVEVDTVYLHAQGLLVPVAGSVSLLCGEDGAPERFLLSVEPGS